jgi:hypothetical protein
MRNRLVYNEETETTHHELRDDKHALRRHKRFSHKQGDIVEYIGRDKKKRGIGIVLYETNVSGVNPDSLSGDFKANVPDSDFTHLRIFWQNTLTEEVLHKGFVRKIPDVQKEVVVLPRK